MLINITEEERIMLDKLLGIAVWNGNHADQIAFETNGEQYRDVCHLYNKINAQEG